MITIDNVEYEKVLYISIPKTASCSMIFSLKNKGLDNWQRFTTNNHDPYHLLIQNNHIDDKVFKFTIVRNPYTRTYSYFKHFNIHNNLNFSFKQFLEYVHKKNDYLSVRTKFVFYNQSYFIFHENKLAVDKIYKFEKLNDVEKDLNINLKKINKGNYTIDEYYSNYDDEAIENVRHMYHEDFINFNYSTVFLR